MISIDLPYRKTTLAQRDFPQAVVVLPLPATIYFAVYPPSIIRMEPVKKLAFSLAMYV
jgi:hypothetical protein